MVSKKHIVWSIEVMFSLMISVLLVTVIRSGAFYQLNPDEWAHVNVSYLLIRGYVPYTQFFLTFTPLFHWFIAPIFILRGFTIDAVTFARWVMGILFLLRLALAGILAFQIFGKRIAALFILLFLLDPFTVFTAMQIRPDNLMMVLLTAGFVVLAYGIRTHTSRYLFWSGILFATSAIVLWKIVPSLIVLWAALLWYVKIKKAKFNFFTFILGFLIPPLFLLSYTLASGNTIPMMHQIFIDSYAINKSLAFPVPLNHFYDLNNPALFDLYGPPGSPLVLFTWSLPILAIIGVAVSLSKLHLGRKRWSSTEVIALTLIGSLIAQSISLFMVHSVFIQYFLPVSWLFALFSAIAIVWGFSWLAQRKFLYEACVFVCALALFVLVPLSIKTNIMRAGKADSVLLTSLQNTWARVPQSSAVYPGTVFRPIVYPLTFEYYMHDLPQSVIKRLPPLVATLEKSKVPYIQSTYEWKALPPEFVTYVLEKYQHIEKTDLYIRR